MATIKDKTMYVCSECGFDSPKWSGKCPSCGMWNTMKEMTVKAQATQSATVTARKEASGKTDDPQPVSDALAMTVAVGAQFLLTFAFIEQWFMWIVVNGANLVMWAIAATRGVQFAPIMVVQYVFYMMNSIYGIVWWSKMSKKA